MALLPVVIVQSGGGRLGNILFVYARALDLMAQGARVYVNLGKTNPAVGLFREAFPRVSWKEPRGPWERFPFHYEFSGRPDKLPPHLFSRTGVYFMGEYFFERAKDRVREDLVFDESAPALAAAIERIEAEESSVSVHVRRGDYVQKHERYGGICTVPYYRKAAEHLRERYPEARFHVFSDDLAWCEEELGLEGAVYEDLRGEEGYRDWWDMCLMSHCRHNIIANSTFSWWGAWLNAHPQKIVICPPCWDNKEPRKDRPDMICAEGWTVIDGRD